MIHTARIQAVVETPAPSNCSNGSEAICGVCVELRARDSRLGRQAGAGSRQAGTLPFEFSPVDSIAIYFSIFA